MRVKGMKIALLCSIVTISLITGVLYIGGNKHSIHGTNESILKFNAKTVAYTPEETSSQEESINKEELPTEVDNSQAVNNISSEDLENVKKEEIPTFEGINGIEFVKYTVKANDTLWKIVKANMPNYSSYPVGGVAGVVSYIGKENNLKKDNNDDYIVYSGQKITIPREKNITAKGIENNNSSVTVNTALSVTKKTNSASKPSSNVTTSTNSTTTAAQNSTTKNESITENNSSNVVENNSTQVSSVHSGH